MNFSQRFCLGKKNIMSCLELVEISKPFFQNCQKILGFSTEEPMLFLLLSVVNLHSNYYKTFSIHFHN